MIEIKIPNNNINEREYILDVIFNEFLGLKYKVEVKRKKEEDNWEIKLPNKKTLIIKDTFFSKYPKDLEYLKFENIPKKLEDLDMFAACFFMLSRWEEYVDKTRDKHDRFLATQSLAYKQGFLDRPVVNEYVQELKNMLLKLDENLKFKIQKPKLILTHDVDSLYQWRSFKHIFRVMLGDLIKRKSIKLALQRFKEYYLIKKGKLKDSFDNFDWLMEQSESMGIKSRFYFMSGGTSSYDNAYKIDESKSLELIKKIQDRGHIIGIHPSYNAYNDTKQFKKEKDLLENVIEEKVIEGREHYLRFEVPTTWQIYEDNCMLVDSTCGYADKEGFRCGTGDEFSVFNILTRKKLTLKERPLIFMDSRDFTCGGFKDTTQFNHNLFGYIEQSLKTDITILFHNDIFKRNKQYKSEYLRIIDVWNQWNN